MANRTIDFSRHAIKSLRKLFRSDPDAFEYVLADIENLADDPHPPNAAKLKGFHPERWRIRVGDYRVIYSLPDDDTVLIQAAGHRNDVYAKDKRRTG